MNLSTAKNGFRYWSSLTAVVIGLVALLILSSMVWVGDQPAETFALAAGGLIAGGYMAWRFLGAKPGLPSTKLDWAVIALIAGTAISLIFSRDPRVGLDRAAWVVFYVCLFYLIADAFEAGLDRKAVLHGLLWFSGFILLAAVFETYAWYLGWWNSVGSRSVMPLYPYRFTSLINHANGFMGLANLCAPFALIGFLTSKGRAERVLSGLWLVLFAITIPFSSSRGGWLGLAFWLVLFLVLWAWSAQKIRPAIAWVKQHRFMVMVAGGLALVLVALAALRFYMAFAAANPTHGSAFALNREAIWGYALDIWKASPLTGSGPGRYGLTLLTVDAEYPPGWWPHHAHSVPLQILAEFGLVTFLPFAILVVGGAIAIVRKGLASPNKWRLESLAVLASLASYALQVLFDDYSTVPLLMAIPILLAVWVWTADEKPLLRYQRFPLSAMAVPGLFLVGLGAWNLWAYSPLYAATAAEQRGDWANAAALAEESLRRDPNLFYYHGQAGIAWGMVWGQSGDPQALEKARQRLKENLALEPDYSVLWADLAVLDWQARQPEEAINAIQKAIHLSPSFGDYQLNLGWFLEQSGREAEALQAYQTALQLMPEWASHPFWQGSSLRKSAVTQVEQASAAYPYLTLARNQMNQGDLQAARISLANASLMEEPSLEIQLERGKLSEQSGLAQQAEKDYAQLANSMLEAYWDFPGPAREYNLFLRRRGFSVAIVPGYLRLEAQYGQAAALQKLVSWQIQTKDCANAAITRTVLVLQSAGRWLPSDVEKIPACP